MKIQAYRFGSMTVDNQLHGNDLKIIEEPTDQAIHTFNRLFREGKKVAGAFHLTC